jgi:SAM-dependent methyltransferase
VASAAELLDLEKSAQILDFCCGPGRHAIALAGLGHRVTGVDRTVPYLEIGKEKARAAGVDVVFERADVRDFRRVAEFDAAISLFTSFGYFEDPRDDQKVLANVHASLKPGGKLLMDMSGKEIIARAFHPLGWEEPEPGVLVLQERKVRDGWEGIENRWIIIRDGERVEKRFSIRLYSGIELKAMMLSAGFAHVDLYGTLEGAPYDQTARRLVAVGVK